MPFVDYLNLWLKTKTKIQANTYSGYQTADKRKNRQVLWAGREHIGKSEAWRFRRLLWLSSYWMRIGWLHRTSSSSHYQAGFILWGKKGAAALQYHGQSRSTGGNHHFQSVGILNSPDDHPSQLPSFLWWYRQARFLRASWISWADSMSYSCRS